MRKGVGGEGKAGVRAGQRASHPSMGLLPPREAITPSEPQRTECGRRLWCGGG